MERPNKINYTDILDYLNDLEKYTRELEEILDEIREQGRDE